MVQDRTISSIASDAGSRDVLSVPDAQDEGRRQGAMAPANAGNGVQLWMRSSGILK
jgi:hypothetical protein